MQQTVVIGAVARAGSIGTALRAWAEAERGRFVPWLPVCMAAGVVLYFSLSAEPERWVGAAVAGLFALLCVPAWGSFWPRLGALAGLAAAVGFLSAQVASWRTLPLDPLPARAVVMTGTVRAADILPDGRRLVLDQ